MSLDYPILPICQTAESFRNILSAMGPYRDSISLKKSPLLGLYTGSEAQLDLATVRYHALGAYAKSVYLIFHLVESQTCAVGGWGPMFGTKSQISTVFFTPSLKEIEQCSLNTFCFEIDDQSNTFNNDLSDPIRHSKNIQ